MQPPSPPELIRLAEALARTDAARDYEEALRQRREAAPAHVEQQHAAAAGETSPESMQPR